MVPRDAQDSDRKRSSSKSIDDLSDEEASEFLGALKAYVRANAPALLLDPNVTSVGIGYRTIKGKPQTKDGKPVPAIQFTSRRKRLANERQQRSRQSWSTSARQRYQPHSRLNCTRTTSR